MLTCMHVWCTLANTAVSFHTPPSNDGLVWFATLDYCNDKQISLLLGHKAFSGLSVLCRSVSEDSVGVLYISICEQFCHMTSDHLHDSLT